MPKLIQHQLHQLLQLEVVVITEKPPQQLNSIIRDIQNQTKF
jgi:hypothetical protein